MVKRFILITAMLFVFASCEQAPDISGKWQETGSTGTLELRKDGTFHAVDNMGMAVNGEYTLHKNGNVRFEIEHAEGPVEIINEKFSLRADTLTFTSADGREIEKYKRQ